MSAAVHDLLEIRRASDPVLKHLRINRSAVAGLIVVDVTTEQGLKLSVVLSDARALLVAELLRKAAKRK